MVKVCSVMEHTSDAHRSILTPSSFLTFQHVANHDLGIHNVAMYLRNARPGLQNVVANNGDGFVGISRQRG